MPTRPLVAALAGVVVVAGCGGDAAGDAPADRSVARETVAAGEHLEVWGRLVATGIDEAAGLSGDVTTRAATLLAELDGLLRTHVVTVTQATEAHVLEHDTAFRSATAVVEENRAALVSTLTDLYDGDLAAGFGDPWRLLTEHTYRYARAVRAGADRDRQEAAEEMERLAGDIAEHLSDTTGGVLDAGSFEEALIHSVEAITRTVRHQHPGQEPWAEALRRAVEAAAEPAELLAAAIAHDRRLEGGTDTDAARLRAELSAAMAGSAWFVPFLAGAGTVGADRQAQVETARSALEEQTDAIRRALEQPLDAPAAADVAGLWHRHHDLLVDLAAAFDDGDREAVEDELATWARDFAGTLDEVTDGALDAAAMEREARRHVETVAAVFRARAEQP